MRLLISCLLLLLSIQTTWAETRYSKTAELPPLRVSFSDLQGVLDKAAKLEGSVVGNRLVEEKVKLGSGKTEIVISGHQLLPAGARIPDRIDKFTYSYSSLIEDAPIKRVDLDFRDFSRTLTVEGPAPEQVDAVFATLREDLTNLSSNVGGHTLTFFLGMPAYFMLVPLLLWSSLAWFLDRNQAARSLLIFALTALALLLLLPIDDLLTGFSATKGEPSFMIRYGPHMGFVGFLLGIVPFIVGAHKRLGAAPRAEQPDTVQPTDASSPSVVETAILEAADAKPPQG